MPPDPAENSSSDGGESATACTRVRMHRVRVHRVRVHRALPGFFYLDTSRRAALGDTERDLLSSSR